MFGLRDKTPEEEPVGLRLQVAAWADSLPQGWPSWLRTSLVVAGMLIGGTVAICLAPVLLFGAVFVMTQIGAHPH